jgi:thymidylate synthase
LSNIRLFEDRRDEEVLERRVSSTAVVRSLFDLRWGRWSEEREEVDSLEAVVEGVEAEPEERCFCLAEERIMERMF